MNDYERNVLELVMRYVDVARAQLLLDDMDGVPGIYKARSALSSAQNAVDICFKSTWNTQLRPSMLRDSLNRASTRSAEGGR